MILFIIHAICLSIMALHPEPFMLSGSFRELAYPLYNPHPPQKKEKTQNTHTHPTGYVLITL